MDDNELVKRLKEIEEVLEYHRDNPIDDSGQILDIVAELLDLIYDITGVTKYTD